MTSSIQKGMCHGCPWDYGSEATEMAYNLGCLPSVHEATELSRAAGKAWACHDDPEQMCCGYAAQNKQDRDLLGITVAPYRDIDSLIV